MITENYFCFQKKDKDLNKQKFKNKIKKSKENELFLLSSLKLDLLWYKNWNS